VYLEEPPRIAAGGLFGIDGEVDFGGERASGIEVAEVVIAHVEEHLASITSAVETAQ
jgi:hypothetical protein